MPFAKKNEGNKFYTGLNLLKSYWKGILDNINSTPQQQTEAANNLMYLCAETPSERAFRKLALLSFYGNRMGYKIPASIDMSNTEEDPLDKIVNEMLVNLGGVK
jgi:hypothetical protein